MKEFFSINEKFRPEWNDLRALLQVLNVILIMVFGLQFAWFGLAIAFFGICKDLSQHRHINEIVMHSAGVILNIYLITIA